mmetsp:Transcript_15836/g.25591  ORF Transcript_15836/g.25591 Transcript_15836/m.25591 type:complete len:102 (+) Transcript_15836:143-448(+)
MPKWIHWLRRSFGAGAAAALAISATGVGAAFAWSETWSASGSRHADSFHLAIVVMSNFELHFPPFIQGAISLAENGALMNKDIFSYRAAFGWRDEAIALFV